MENTIKKHTDGLLRTRVSFISRCLRCLKSGTGRKCRHGVVINNKKQEKKSEEEKRRGDKEEEKKEKEVEHT